MSFYRPGASLVAQMVKNLIAMQETWVRSLGWEDLLEKGMTNHSSILVWRIPWTGEPGGLQSTRWSRVGYDRMTNILTLTLYSRQHVVVQLLSRVWLLQPQGLQHTRLSCPSLSPRVCSSSHPLSWWCPPTILSSVTLFSSCLQFFPASRSFPMSQFFALDGQSIGASASAPNEYSVLIYFRID